MSPSNKIASWIQELEANEDRSIVRGLGSLAFVRSQGRTLATGSQEKVLALLWTISGELQTIKTAQEFDQRHEVWVNSALHLLRTTRKKPLAYGQGQKTINVFLKFYVDWASRPTAEAAARIRPWLHCPLDKVVMEALRSLDADSWRVRIWEPQYRGRVMHQRRASMSMIDAPAYQAWQQWIRELSPHKPVLIDAVWSLTRPINAVGS